jgi:hypothetical protein
MLARLLLLGTVLYASWVPTFAEAAGWVLIIPPLDKNGNLIRNAPVSSWGQWAAFDNAAQCEQHRMANINDWQSWMEDPKTDLKLREFLRQQWINSFSIRCMPYDLWWRAQEPAR